MRGLDQPIRFDDRRLRERHRDQRPGDHQDDERDRADELAQADRHGIGRSIAGTGTQLYGPRHAIK